MSTTALRIIQDEHQALAAIIRSMSMLVTQARRLGTEPPFDVLRAMLFYIDEFPERLHHSKESDLLFPMLRHRAPHLTEVTERLDREHHGGESAIRDLEHALIAYELMGQTRAQDFEERLARYSRFYLEHMATEEREILPAMRTYLQAEDWAALDAAFASHRDPLTGHDPEPTYRGLFQRIVNHAPAPVGLGAPIQA